MTTAYEPWSFEARVNPGPIWDEMRRECPVAHVPAHDYYAVSRYHDIVSLMRDTKTWSSKFGPGLAHANPPNQGALVGVDPPEHDAQRNLVNRVFNARAVTVLEPDIVAYVEDLIAGMAPVGGADLVPEFAARIPMFVIAKMLGLPLDRIDTLREFVDTATMAVLGELPGGKMPAEVAQSGAFLTALVEERFEAAARGDELPDDLISRLVAASAEGTALNRAVVHGMVGFILIGGSGTTTMLIGNLLYRLLTIPEQRERLRADPALIDNAIEESLRFDAPVHGLFRTPNEGLELHGVTIPKDCKVQMLYGSGNLDPEAFEDPTRFDIARDFTAAPPHLAFGYGTHFCLGAALARMEARIGVLALLERLPNLRLAGQPVPTRPAVLKGWDHLPVAWDVAVAAPADTEGR